MIKHLHDQNKEQKGESTSLRDEHNRDLIRRMRNGEPLTSFLTVMQVGFHRAPLSKKMKRFIRELYDRDDSKQESGRSDKQKQRQIRF